MVMMMSKVLKRMTTFHIFPFVTPRDYSLSPFIYTFKSSSFIQFHTHTRFIHVNKRRKEEVKGKEVEGKRSAIKNNHNKHYNDCS